MQVDINASPQPHPGPLSPVFYSVINQFFSESCVPPTYKTYIIVPVQKQVIMSCLKDSRPRALTSASMKCIERLILSFTQNRCCPPPGPFPLLPTEPVSPTVSQQNMFLLKNFLENKKNLGQSLYTEAPSRAPSFIHLFLSSQHLLTVFPKQLATEQSLLLTPMDCSLLNGKDT